MSSGMISVLIVNHNGGEVLGTCLDQLHQCGGFHEVIVADNASTDGSLDAVRDRHPEVRVLELGANLGFGAANNRAAAEAEGDSLLLLNSDAWPHPGCLEALERELATNPRLAWIAPRLAYPDGRAQFHWAPTTSVLGEAVQMLRNRFESRPWIHRMNSPWLRPLLGPGWYTAACALVRRSAFEAVGGFDEGYFLYFEDVDICIRLRRAGFALAEAPNAEAVHIKGGSQDAGGGAVGLEYRRSQIRYYRLHRPRWERRVLARRLGRRFGDHPELGAELQRLSE